MIMKSCCYRVGTRAQTCQGWSGCREKPSAPPSVSISGGENIMIKIIKKNKRTLQEVFIPSIRRQQWEQYCLILLNAGDPV